ncbi:5'-nucleotidase C-terminal domain-containing protein [Roseibium aggregatum]|uniref:5'-nucleotidase C-terminal domain-containing protein n=1 Tax=Roseibium aggregatum TaxID=187304 RepID=A0A939EEK0_9HYPH|nr:5'-nucleotidase C-terminal domain-containing protein [Roseibium aggregatum]MBN9671331.1 5'-nucleotidase C-terminal domain-containing protein [Roseibium aggregatum]
MGFHSSSNFLRGLTPIKNTIFSEKSHGLDEAIEKLSANLQGFSFQKSGFDLGGFGHEKSGLFGFFHKGFSFGNLVIGTPGDDTLKGNSRDNIILGFSGDDYIRGKNGNDKIFAGAGDDTIKGGRGKDFIYGGDGEDTAVFSGYLSDYEIDRDGDEVTVTDLRWGRRDGKDTLVNVEYLQFKDQTISLVEPETFTLELLHFTDQEAALGAIEDAPNLSAVLNALRGEDLGDDGVADNTLTLSSGDAFIPGLFYDASEAVFGSGGIADIQIQNELGVQAIALGNHEFDFGTAELAGLISGDAAGDFSALSGTALDGLDFTGTDMPYLSTNLDYSTDANLAPLEVDGGQAPQGNAVSSSTVIDVNGELIGIVGATTPTLGSISSPGTLGISPVWAGSTPTSEELDDLAAIIQTEVDALLAANPGMNKIILLAHMQQIDIELALAERLENVDIIVAGGSNTRLFDDNDRARDGDSDQGEYPTFVTNAGGTATAVVNTDGSYKYVGRLVIDFDADGNIIADSYDAEVSGAYATDDQGVADLDAEGLIDPEIQAIVDAIQDEIVETESNVFGVSNVFLNGNRSGSGDAGDPDGVRTQETNLGNLTADANREYADEFFEGDAEVVISIKNGGGIRASIGQTVVPPGGSEAERLPNEEVVDGDGNVVKPEGGISENDIKTTLAFNNGLTLLTLTKTEIVALLEHGVSAVPGVSGRFPQISGVKLSYDPDLPEGARIVNAGIFDDDGNLIAELVRDGEIAGDADATFRVVTLDFLAASRFDEDGNFIGGGDGYPFPNLNEDPDAGELGDPDVIARVNATPLVQEGVATGDATFADDGTEQDALAEYLADNFATADTAYDEEDTGLGEDGRIQNLNFREDDVLPEAEDVLVINEVLGSTTGADSEYIELYGTPGKSLAGLSLIVVESDDQSSNGSIDRQFDFADDAVIGDNGFYLVANSTAQATYSVTPDALLADGFVENSSYTLALVETASLTGSAVSGAEVVLDTVGVSDGETAEFFHFDAPVVGPDGSFLPAGVVRVEDGVDTDTADDWALLDFNNDPAVNTPTSANGIVSGPAEVAIYDIQGAGHRSGYEGETVRTTGIVTAIAANGFYIQDAEGDGDIATSDGVFVYGSASGLAVGHEVQVDGSVVEYQFEPALSLTEISMTGVSVLSTGNALPDAVVLGVDRIQPTDVIDDDGLASFDPETDAIDFLESLEGMLVEVDNPLVVAGTNRFGEVTLAAGRGDESGTEGNKNAVVSEGDFNPEILLTDDALVDAPFAFTGDTFAANPVGVMDYTFGAYKLQLVEDVEVVSGGREQETSALYGDLTHMTVATVNTLNLNPDTGNPSDAEVDRLDMLAQTIVRNLNAPDVIALQEIQDNSGATDDGVTNASQTLQELVDAIAIAGGPQYAFASIDPVDGADGGQPGANIQNAFLYNPARVTLDPASLGKIEDSAFEEGGDGTAAEAAYEGTRKPLVGDFTFNLTGETVTIVGNHLKSKSQDDGLFGENQPPVQVTLDQRVDQATVINAFVEGEIADGNNVIVLGDMNDFQFSDTLDALANGGDDTAELINLVDFLELEDQYSFIFNGNSQMLDHILVNDALLAAAEIDAVHVNLDFGFPDNNASDHDPLLARFNMTGDLFTA